MKNLWCWKIAFVASAPAELLKRITGHGNAILNCWSHSVSIVSCITPRSAYHVDALNCTSPPQMFMNEMEHRLTRVRLVGPLSLGNSLYWTYHLFLLDRNCTWNETWIIKPWWSWAPPESMQTFEYVWQRCPAFWDECLVISTSLCYWWIALVVIWLQMCCKRACRQSANKFEKMWCQHDDVTQSTRWALTNCENYIQQPRPLTLPPRHKMFKALWCDSWSHKTIALSSDETQNGCKPSCDHKKHASTCPPRPLTRLPTWASFVETLIARSNTNHHAGYVHTETWWIHHCFE